MTDPGLIIIVGLLTLIHAKQYDVDDPRFATVLRVVGVVAVLAGLLS